MRTSAVVAALLGALVAGSAAGNLALAKKRPPPKRAAAALDASSCPEFSQSTDQRGRTITFQLDNRCPQAIRCELSWRVACPGSEAGGAHEQQLDIDGKSRQSAQASADACGDGSWKISPAEWTCRFQPDASNTASR
jgi:hypothetical protein